MKKSGTSKGILALVLAVVVLVAVYALAWRPRAAELSTIQSGREAMEQELAGLEAANAASLIPAAEDPATALLAVAIPEGPELPNLLRQLSTIATETGVDQKTLTPSNLAPNTGVPGASILVTITASGSKASAVEYVRRLGGLERIFVVDKVTLSSATASDPTADPSALIGLFDLEVTGRVFTTDTAAAPA